jgi:hypothetical protein
MENLIKEELNKMKYLFGYQRGVVISEQEDEPFEREYSSRFDWNGKQKGMMDFTAVVMAKNVGYNKQRYNVSTLSSIPRLVGSGKEEIVQTPPEKKPIPVLTELNLLGSAFPYPDNMVQAKFESFPEAKKVYDAFIQSILDFLKVAPANQMGTLTIQGTADAARPTYDIPKGYSKLDHPGTLYNGLKDANEMNQYLADTRASELGKLIVQDVLNKTGINISKNIVYEKGINYYGQKDKRGFDYKNVTVKPSQSKVNVNQPDKVILDKPGSQTSSSSVKPAEPVQQYLDLRPWGGQLVPATMFPNGTVGVKYEIIEKLGLFTGDKNGVLGYYNNSFFDKKEVMGEIKKNQFFVDGMSFGDIVTASSDTGTYDSKAESSVKFVTSRRPCIITEREGWEFIELVGFGFQSPKG